MKVSNAMWIAYMFKLFFYSTVYFCRYISVDVYGGCSKHKCSRKKNSCRKMLSDDYKFYLAFENCNCIEYITEKPAYQALL